MIIIGGGLLVVVAAAVVMLALGLVRPPGFENSARPPCERLPAAAAVEEALAANRPLVTRIEQVGAGVTVTVSRPCGAADRALARISVASGQERTGVDAILREDGFGVPVELVDG